jgi:putative membrane protein
MRIELKSRPRKGPGQWVTQWLVSAVGLALAARFVNGVELTARGTDALLIILGASALLGLLNLLLKPFLILITLPVNILTLGLFTLAVNAVVLLAAVALVPGLRIASFWSAILAALVISLSSMLLNSLLGSAQIRIQRDRGNKDG